MKYQNKYNDFTAEVIINLRQLLEKGYDQEDLWNQLLDDEESDYDKFPSVLVKDDDGGYIYYIVKWDGESFLGYNDENMDWWFTIEELDLFTLCQIADYLEQD